MEYPKLYFTLQQLLDATRRRVQEIAGREAEVIALTKNGLFLKARSVLDQWRTLAGDTGEIWYREALVCAREQDLPQAAACLLKALALQPGNALYHLQFGAVMAEADADDLAREYLAVLGIGLEPDSLPSRQRLAVRGGNLLAMAVDLLRWKILAAPDNMEDRLRLGRLLLARRDLAGAIAVFESARAAAPDNAEILDNLAAVLDWQGQVARSRFLLGRAHSLRGNRAEAIAAYQQGLALETGDPGVYLDLARQCEALRRRQEEIQACEEGLRRYPDLAELYWYWVRALRELGRIAEALRISAQARARFPENLPLTRQHRLLLPKVYRSEQELEVFRDRYAEGLRGLCNELDTALPERAAEAFESIRETNFYLAYQCRNDIDLQRLDGQYVHRVMSARYPEWSTPVPMPPEEPGGRIRIGYIASHLIWHPVARMFLGWLAHRNAAQFEVFVYHVFEDRDFMTDQFEQASDHFRTLPLDVAAIAQSVLADRLHLLVHLDIGLHALLTKTAGLRLAPIQCTAWSHPVTTGLPTIDYYLSGDWVEPSDADAHYTETLVRLPRIGASLPRPFVPELRRDRTALGLSEEAVIYVVPHPVFKLLPQYDPVYARIARRVPQARFLFLMGSRKEANDILLQRLRAAFTDAGLEADAYLIFAPRQRYFDYLEMLCLADLCLDSFGWSGGMTAIDVLGCGLPLVTCSSEFMRGRQSAAYLRGLGIEETVASSVADYVEIAVRLGLDPAERRRLAQAIRTGADGLFGDRSCVAGLEAFYQDVVAERWKMRHP